MNVYLYAGENRETATTQLIFGNDQLTVGKTYSVDYTKGMLLIAYPERYVDTEFKFSYWIGGYSPYVIEEGYWVEMQNNDPALFYICIVVTTMLIFVMMLMCLCVNPCCICFRRCCVKD